MKRQELLDFGGERVAAREIWRQLPPASRKEAVAHWARLIAAAVQRRSIRRGAHHEHAKR